MFVKAVNKQVTIKTEGALSVCNGWFNPECKAQEKTCHP